MTHLQELQARDLRVLSNNIMEFISSPVICRNVPMFFE